MTDKNKKNAEVFGNFCKYRNQKIKSFLDSFDSNLSNQKYQCFNCEVWKPGRKLLLTHQFDEMTRELFNFRFCRACWEAYQNVEQEMKKEFIDRITEKIKEVSEVKV